MSNPDLEQNLGQEEESPRTRRVPSLGIGRNYEGNFVFAGEPGGPPSFVELSGAKLEAYEKAEEECWRKMAKLAKPGSKMSETAERHLAKLG